MQRNASKTRVFVTTHVVPRATTSFEWSRAEQI